MKAIVEVRRTGFGFQHLALQIPNNQIKGKNKRQQQELFKKLALEQAGDFVFVEKGYEYRVEEVKIL